MDQTKTQRSPGGASTPCVPAAGHTAAVRSAADGRPTTPPARGPVGRSPFFTTLGRTEAAAALLALRATLTEAGR